MKFSNQLSDAELERLAILSEELGEAQQIVGKILRHGYESKNPDIPASLTNRQLLEKALGDVYFWHHQFLGPRPVDSQPSGVRK